MNNDHAMAIVCDLALCIGREVTLDALLYALLYLFGLAFAFYPLVKWCRENEGFSWPWPHVESEKKRIKKLRREQEQEQQSGSEKK